MRGPLLHWLFYGHLWIALAALALSWQSTYLANGDASLGKTHFFVFFATLGVYTLHRLLSYRRAGSEPGGRRYRLVGKHPTSSALIGSLSIGVAVGLTATFPLRVFWPVIYALPFTFFYLIPLYPGGPRLRDLPYLKVVWVAVAWMLMTDVFPVSVIREETGIRFALTLSIALLFDTRDVVLDRRQGVRTLASTHASLNRKLALGLLVACGVISVWLYGWAPGAILLSSYLAAAAVGAATRAERGENFYAVYVNGALFFPPLALLLYYLFN